MQYRGLYEDCSPLIQKQTVYVNIKEGETPNMWYFHMHSHYEISMILSGDVTVFMPEQIHSGTEARIVMLRPYTEHFMIPERDHLYRRINISFTEEFVAEMALEWAALIKLFPMNGGILLPDAEQCRHLEQIAMILEKEEGHMQSRLLLMYFLSLLSDLPAAREAETAKIPDYILKALQYLSEHFHEKMTADELAGRLGISRTTLMTGFRRYVGVTIHRYQQNLRLRQASYLRLQGMSVEEAAIASGFCDSGGYIRSHRRVYGTTPLGKE